MGQLMPLLGSQCCPNSHFVLSVTWTLYPRQTRQRDVNPNILALSQSGPVCAADFVAECTSWTCLAQVLTSFEPQLPTLREDDSPSSVGEESLTTCSEGQRAMVHREPAGTGPAVESRLWANGRQEKRKLEDSSPGDEVPESTLSTIMFYAFLALNRADSTNKHTYNVD